MNFVMSPAYLLNALPLWLSGRADRECLLLQMRCMMSASTEIIFY